MLKLPYNNNFEKVFLLSAIGRVLVLDLVIVFIEVEVFLELLVQLEGKEIDLLV